MTKSKQVNVAALAAVLDAQHGVISREQAKAVGLSKDAIGHRVRRNGPWRRLLPAVYLTVTGTPTLVQREMAALLYAGDGSMLTGLAGLRGRGGRAAIPARLDVLVPDRCGVQSTGFVLIRRTTRMPGSPVLLGARRYAPVERAVADAARWSADLPVVRGLVAGIVQRGECSLAQLVRELCAGPRRGSALLRQVLGEVADGARSGVEAELMDLIRRARLPKPVLNACLYDENGVLIAIPDEWWPDHGVAAEVDSREWHLSPADWERTMRRHAEMSSHGIIVLHFTPRQIRTQPKQVIATIAAALQASTSRPSLPVTFREAA